MLVRTASMPVVSTNQPASTGHAIELFTVVTVHHGVQDVLEKHRKQFDRAVARYKLQTGVEGEDVKLMHNVEIATGVSKYVEALHEGTMPDPRRTVGPSKELLQTRILNQSPARK